MKVISRDEYLASNPSDDIPPGFTLMYSPSTRKRIVARPGLDITSWADAIGEDAVLVVPHMIS